MGWRSRWAVGVVIAGDLLGTGALPTVASGAAVRAQADTYVSAAAPRSTHGTDARLLAGRSPERRAYLRFRLPAGSIERATLRVFSLAAHQEGFNVRRIGSSGWSERRVTYRSMPEALGAAVRARPP